jgi:toxin ParE1/3/4
MNRKLSFTDSALEDLRDIAAYIADRSASNEIADAFLDRLIGHCEKMAGLPGTLGSARPELGPDLRSDPIGSYICFFRYRATLFEVVGVVRASRDLAQLFLANRD